MQKKTGKKGIGVHVCFFLSVEFKYVNELKTYIHVK